MEYDEEFPRPRFKDWPGRHDDMCVMIRDLIRRVSYLEEGRSGTHSSVMEAQLRMINAEIKNES